MFDFAKTELKVYDLQISEAADRKASPTFRFGLPLLALVMTGITGYNLMSGKSDTSVAQEQQTVPSAAYIQPLPGDQTATEHSHGLDMDDLTAESQLTNEDDLGEEVAQESSHDWKEHKIQSGESLSTIFNDLGLGQSLLTRLSAASPKEYSLSKLKPGQTIKVKRDTQGNLEELVWVKSQMESLSITPKDDSFDFKQSAMELEKRERHASGVINSSLFLDGQKMGLSDKTISNLMEIFKWDIDFAIGLKKGDQFNIIYDQFYAGDKKHSDGPILAAEFVSKGKRYRAVRYQYPDGRTEYFTPEGKNMRKAFIMTPVAYTRISSKFTPDRWHPVLQKWRAHKGVDYAAPVGTPVKAAAEGKIVYSGWQGGYGNVVIIEHAKQHSTVYGHLSKFGANAKVGANVSQGTVIGYVGQTGLASGPHLHYEIRIAGKFVDPVKVTSLGTTREVPKQDAKIFKHKAQSYFAKFDLHKGERVAQLIHPLGKGAAAVE